MERKNHTDNQYGYYEYKIENALNMRLNETIWHCVVRGQVLAL